MILQHITLGLMLAIAGADDGFLFPGSAWPFGPSDGDEGDMRIVDLDGDGTDELLYTSFGDIEVRSSADGFQTLMQVLDLGFAGELIHPVDADADGDLDLYVSGRNNPNLAFVRTVNGVLTLEQVVDVGDNLNDSTVGDVNADGWPDVGVTTGSPTDRTVVYTSAGAGTLTLSQDFLANARSPDFTDIDVDGDVDLIADDWTSHDLFVWLNDGTGKLAEAVSVLPSPEFRHELVADLDGDGDPDLVDHERRVHRNDGNLQFTLIQGETDITVRELNDVNADGILDVIGVANPEPYDTDAVAICIGLGDGFYFEPVHYEVLGHVAGVELYDVDGDGLDDLLTGGRRATTVLHAVAPGEYETNQIVPLTAPAVRELTAADVDGDGIEDLIVTHDWAFPGNITIMRGVDGQLETFAVLSAPAGPRAVAPADLDADGVLDLVTANVGMDGVGVLMGTGGGGFAGATSIALDAPQHAVDTVDLDGDGLADIACASGDSDEVTIMKNLDGATFEVSQVLETSILDFCRIIAADIDGDDDSDLLLSGVFPPSVMAFINESGVFSPGVSVASMDGDGRAFAVADVDADGDVDLAIPNDQSVRVLLNDGTGAFILADAIPLDDDDMQSISFGDVNADARLDLLVDLASNGASKRVYVILGDGTGQFQTSELLVAGKFLGFAALLDFDGDGDDDAVSSDGDAHIPIALRAYVATPAGCAADINGDGVLDILDFVAFQSAWQAMAPIADCDANTVFNVLDFVCYQTLFQAGCP